jgi:hypothetical protein
MKSDDAVCNSVRSSGVENCGLAFSAFKPPSQFSTPLERTPPDARFLPSCEPYPNNVFSAAFKIAKALSVVSASA